MFTGSCTDHFGKINKNLYFIKNTKYVYLKIYIFPDTLFDQINIAGLINSDDGEQFKLLGTAAVSQVHIYFVLSEQRHFLGKTKRNRKTIVCPPPKKEEMTIKQLKK